MRVNDVCRICIFKDYSAAPVAPAHLRTISGMSVCGDIYARTCVCYVCTSIHTRRRYYSTRASYVHTGSPCV